ncbi:MAG TPA: chemotaxis response regulator protein-glutamate methylesterase [Kineosporiaceae bacterium]|nr:chemotaxis response regulator protein-glutamate methylesterase [Kineosporiaceae bacterium]
MSPNRVKVLIVDDSAVVRQVLTAVLDKDPGIDVLGAVPDPIFAMHRMNQHWPDVVLLDVEMPRMDGITFLKELMAVRPTPVVVCSTLTERGAETTLQAMSAGAVAVITKPREGLKAFLESDAADIVRTVKGAALGDMRHMKAVTSVLQSGSMTVQRNPLAASATRQPVTLSVTTDRLVAIGTSTGGTQALEVVLTSMPRVTPGIVIVQHMPEKFTAAFASRLDGLCESEVLEACDGDRVLPGRVLIAPGGRHMTVRRDGAQYRVQVNDGPPVNRHKPSVDVLFRSVAECAGRNAMGVIMTGMGDDGARGLRQMRDSGARTVGQNEATCVVYGMPAEAVKLGAVETEVPLQDIPGLIQRFAAQI